MVNYFKQKIMVYKKIGDTTWDSTGFQITDAFNVRVTEGLGKIKDTFEFNAINKKDKLFAMKYNGDGTTVAFTLPYSPIPSELYSDPEKFIVLVNDVPKVYTTDWTCNGTTITFTSAPSSGNNNIVIRFNIIDLDDRVIIHKWTNSSSETSDNLIIDGSISEVPFKYGPEGNILSVRGRSFIESLFDTAVPITTDTPSSAPAIIQSILTNLTFWNKTRELTWHPSNPTTKADGSAFPTQTYVKNYTNVNEMIEELSSEKYTGDGQYIYWVTTSGGVNYFIWRAKSTAIENTLTQGIAIAKYSRDYNTDEMINVIIYMCGFDINGSPISDLAMDITSISRYGAKFYFLTKYEDTATQLIAQEISTDTSKQYFDYDADGNPMSPFFPKAYNYTIQSWRDRSNGSVLTATSDADFNSKFRAECQAIVSLSAQKIVDKLGLPRMEVSMTLPFTQVYPKGSLQALNLTSSNLYGKNLRLFEVTYGEGEIDFRFKEDEETVVIS